MIPSKQDYAKASGALIGGIFLVGGGAVLMGTIWFSPFGWILAVVFSTPVGIGVVLLVKADLVLHVKASCATCGKTYRKNTWFVETCQGCGKVVCRACLRRVVCPECVNYATEMHDMILLSSISKHRWLTYLQRTMFASLFCFLVSMLLLGLYDYWLTPIVTLGILVMILAPFPFLRRLENTIRSRAKSNRAKSNPAI